MSLIDKRTQKPFREYTPSPSWLNEEEKIFVGPGWFRPGSHVDQPMRDKRLAEEEAVKRMTERDERESRFWWWFFVPSLVCLGCAAYLFHFIQLRIR